MKSASSAVVRRVACGAMFSLACAMFGCSEDLPEQEPLPGSETGSQTDGQSKADAGPAGDGAGGMSTATGAAGRASNGGGSGGANAAAGGAAPASGGASGASAGSAAGGG